MKLKLNNESNIFVLYHGGGCMDGLGARYAAYRKFGDNANYIPVNYKEPLPEQLQLTTYKDYEVYILDFSYSRATLDELNVKIKKLVVLDHHISAEKKLDGAPYANFDMDKSGAVLAWEYFHPGTEVPLFIQHVQDRDLWRFQLPNTELISLAFSQVKFELSRWEDITNVGYQDTLLEFYTERGKAIKGFQTNQIEKLAKDVKIVDLTIFNNEVETHYKVATVNAVDNISELGHYLNHNHPVDFSMSYFIKDIDKVILSFRSRKDGADVSEIATLFGGGGHRNASGAIISLEQLGVLLKGKQPIN